MKLIFEQIPVESAVVASLEALEFAPHVQTGPFRPYAFRYRILIKNLLPTQVVLRARKWILRSDSGVIDVIEATGIVGQAPRIKSGGEFRYESYHLARGPTQVQGSFFGITEFGHPFCSLLKPFRMAPNE